MSNMTKMIAVLGVVAGLGVAALPLSSYAADPKTADTNITLEIEEKLNITATASVALSNTSPIDDSEYSGSATVNVKTNVESGYWIGIVGSTVTGAEGSAATAVTQLASANDTIDTGALSTGTSAWAWKSGTTVSSWTKIPTENALVYQGTKANGDLNITDGTDTIVDFGATIAPTQAAGEYAGKVTFTATAGAKGA